MVVLVSNPFPMIFAYDSDSIHILTINGDLIRTKGLKDIITELGINVNVEEAFLTKKNNVKDKGAIRVIPCIDKDFGIINDSVFLSVPSDKKIEEVEIELPSLKLTIREKKINENYYYRIHCN